MTRWLSIGHLPPAMRMQAEAQLAEAKREIRKRDREPRRRLGQSAPSNPTGKLLWQIRAVKIEEPEREARFDPLRKWRFDMCWRDRKLALEIEGVTHEGGRHQRVQGFGEDCRKYLAATLAGWTVLRVTPDMIRRGEVIEALEQMFHEFDPLENRDKPTAARLGGNERAQT